jgi:FKBP-type peptidyl-prolyl cis-trans isomerase
LDSSDIGWSADGQIVDSSYRRGLEGVPFRLSALNPALSEALRMMVVGDKRRVWIAGSRGRVDGECAPMLVVDVELVGIKPAELPC